MKFTKLIAMIAIVSFASNAMAASNTQVQKSSEQAAQSDSAANSATDGSSNKAINININNSADAGQTQEQSQEQKQVSTAKTKSTAVSTDSQTELLRKARQSAEQETEDRINEKLEVSRLKEERERADRLFGNSLDDDRKNQGGNTQIQTVILPAPQQQQQPAVAPVVAPVAAPVQAAPVVVPAPAPTPAPVVAPAPAKSVEEKAAPAIEKVEIVQPAQPVQKQEAYVAPVPVATPVAVEKSEEAPVVNKKDTRFYIGGVLGTMKYAADNVQTNEAVGVVVGAIFENRYVLEVGYTYSNSNVSDVWSDQLYHNLNQNDFSVAGKYYFLENSFKPYVGVSATYSQRSYTDLYNDGYGYTGISSQTSTNAMDMGALAGIDYQAGEHFMIGLGLDYNFNVYASQDANFASSYLPTGVTPLEKINYTTFKASIKYLF